MSFDIPKKWSSNGSIITNNVETSNVFNNNFAAIAEKSKIKYQSVTQISDFLKYLHMT